MTKLKQSEQFLNFLIGKTNEFPYGKDNIHVNVPDIFLKKKTTTYLFNVNKFDIQIEALTKKDAINILFKGVKMDKKTIKKYLSKI